MLAPQPSIMRDTESNIYTTLNATLNVVEKGKDMVLGVVNPHVVQLAVVPESTPNFPPGFGPFP